MVIDTMIFAYAMLKASVGYLESAKILEKSKKIWVPDSFRAEFANVIWQWVMHHQMPVSLAQEMLFEVETIPTEFVSTLFLWERALELAIEENHPVYDTLFVALAERKQSRVLTYDRKLLRKFPELSMHPAEFLAS